MNRTQAVTILTRRFPGKRAFITGAGSGLGRALAAEFAAAGGLDVMVNNAGVAAAGPVETTPPADWR